MRHAIRAPAQKEYRAGNRLLPKICFIGRLYVTAAPAAVFWSIPVVVVARNKDRYIARASAALDKARLHLRSCSPRIYIAVRTYLIASIARDHGG